MRWPIRFQLLVPVLLVVVLAVIAISVTSAWLAAAQARRQQEGNIQRLSRTIAGGSFPLTQSVLRQMRGLSGAEFVLLDYLGQVQGSTFALTDGQQELLRQLPTSQSRDGFSENPRIAIEGRSYLAERLPIARRHAALQPGSLIVLYPESRWSAAVRKAVYPVLAIGLITVTVVVIVTTTLAQRLIARIRRLGDQTAAIAAGDFTPVPIGPRNDEIRDLAVSINQTTEKLSQYEKEVRRSERLRTLGQLGAGMAHQLRNSATGALMAIELHRRDCPIGTDCESLQVASRQVRLMESYLQRFLTLGSPSPRLHEEVILQTVVQDVLELIRPACTHAKIDVALESPAERLTVRGDPEALRQLLINLLVNAIEAAARQSRPGARVAIELDRLGADRAALHVKDSGPGPAAATKDTLFDPFVSEKPDGTGLGLSVARQIAEEHQGSIRWQRHSGMTCFTVELPLLDPKADHGAPTSC